MALLETFTAILKKAKELQASDVHISAGAPFRMRVRGEVVAVAGLPPLTPTDTVAIAGEILVNARKATAENVAGLLRDLKDLDCSYSVQGVGRFRVNICSQRGSLSVVLRSIADVLPTFESLGLPPILSQIAMEERGLVLLTGTTGSGKSSTLAAMVAYVNQQRAGKIVTIEDPIEFLHKDGRCNVIQREIGTDTESFEAALRAALRQDPDIILVGEMRDRATIDIALKAAETGHMVFSTVHTTDAQR
ncbi:MAG: ATPase, T2SS/T4P/T4SS family, partial [Gemmatimonadota bacterium]